MRYSHERCFWRRKDFRDVVLEQREVQAMRAPAAKGMLIKDPTSLARASPIQRIMLKTKHQACGHQSQPPDYVHWLSGRSKSPEPRRSELHDFPVKKKKKKSLSPQKDNC
jgi:hypothetical protein